MQIAENSLGDLGLFSIITYKNLYDDLRSRAAAELSMAAQAIFLNKTYTIKTVRYAWSEDGTALLTLDCHMRSGSGGGMTFADLRKELASLCQWQHAAKVVVGFQHALVEVVTVYHEFDLANNLDNSLMLVCTPPEEYFEAAAA